jgi:hypothetical protein
MEKESGNESNGEGCPIVRDFTKCSWGCGRKHHPENIGSLLRTIYKRNQA